MERRRRLRSLFDIIESMLEDMESFEEEPMYDAERCCLEPLTEVKETENEIIITADLPGVNKESISIHGDEEHIIIEATLRKEIKFEGWLAAGGEISFKGFRKAIKLPVSVDIERAKTSFRQGILEIRLPKKVKRVKIKIE